MSESALTTKYNSDPNMIIAGHSKSLAPSPLRLANLFSHCKLLRGHGHCGHELLRRMSPGDLMNLDTPHSVGMELRRCASGVQTVSAASLFTRVSENFIKKLTMDLDHGGGLIIGLSMSYGK